MEAPPLSFRPASWYFRRAIRESQTLQGCQTVSLWLVDELEARNAQIRAMGGIPNRLYNPRVILPDGEISEIDERQLELFG